LRPKKIIGIIKQKVICSKESDAVCVQMDYSGNVKQKSISFNESDAVCGEK
jgi:hypothetical protein